MVKVKLIDIRNDLQILTNAIRTYEKRVDFTREGQRLVDEFDIFLGIEKEKTEYDARNKKKCDEFVAFCKEKEQEYNGKS